MSTKMVKPVHLFAGITRKDATTREVEGIFYANAQVGDGYNLPFEVVERAMTGYMQFGTGAIRAMHQPIAAGQALKVWTDKVDGKDCGIVRAKITDDAEWAKVDDGTYKGFSIGFIPTALTRSNKVTAGELPEISLVDRPWDTGCTFTTVYRAEGFQGVDWTKDVAVKVIKRNAEDYSDIIGLATEIVNIQAEIQSETDPDIKRMKTKKLAKAVAKVAKVKSVLNSGNLYYAAQPTMTRSENMPTTVPPANPAGAIDYKALYEQEKAAHGAAQAEIQRLQGKLSKKVLRLAKQDAELVILRGAPASQPPVRFPAGVNRSFAANQSMLGQLPEGGEEINSVDQTKVDAYLKRAAEIQKIDTSKISETEQHALADEIGSIAAQLSEVGITL